MIQMFYVKGTQLVFKIIRLCSCGLDVSLCLLNASERILSSKERFLIFSCLSWSNISIGGSKGGREGRAPPPGGPNSFNFMQFLGKFGKIVCWRPPLGSWRPLLREILDPPLIRDNLLLSLILLLDPNVSSFWD